MLCRHCACMCNHCCLTCSPLQVLLATVILIRWDLQPFVQLLALDSGAKVVCLAAMALLLRSRLTALHNQTWLFGLAALPGFVVIRVVVAGWSSSLAVLFGIVAASQIV